MVSVFQSLAGKQFRQFLRRVHDHVWRSFTQRMGSEAVGYSASPQGSIAAREHGAGRVSDDNGLLRMGTGFVTGCPGAERMGLFGLQAVAGVDRTEILGQ